jgi:hypothetical protein
MMQTMLTVGRKNSLLSRRSAVSDPAGSGWGGSEALKVSEEEMLRE